MKIQERVASIETCFMMMYPEAECELKHNNAFELLVAVMLSAQATDVSVNKLTVNLFVKYKSPQDYIKTPLDIIEEDIKAIGLYRNKAKSLKGMSEQLVESFNSEVPRTVKALMSLPGVGKKTANVVASVAFDVPAIAVDTHVERVSKRLGLVKPYDDVSRVEAKLMTKFKKSYWSLLHHQMIHFGRYFCKAKNPMCHDCPLIKLCVYKNKTK